MPSRNIVKTQSPRTYYHVYARGNSKKKIFLETSDYAYFTHLFERYLSSKQRVSTTGVPYPNFSENVELVSYCLMTNHFHLLVYQKNSTDLEKFMRSLMISYSMYFNKKYMLTGSPFESTYKAVDIDNDAYLQHITRYIHLNPRRWEHYKQSSLKYYRNGHEPEWLKTERVLCLFSSRDEYMQFVSDYEEMKDMLAEIKYSLADH